MTDKINTTIDKIKRERMVNKHTKQLKCLGSLKRFGILRYPNKLPKQDRLHVRTVGEFVDNPQVPNPSRGFVREFWESNGCHIDLVLYERFVNVKISVNCY